MRLNQWSLRGGLHTQGVLPVNPSAPHRCPACSARLVNSVRIHDWRTMLTWGSITCYACGNKVSAHPRRAFLDFGTLRTY